MIETGQTREMKFFKPVNLPGLASTRGVKLQRFKHYEDIGLILYSSTRLEDIPAADTFSVEDVLIVRDDMMINCYRHPYYYQQNYHTVVQPLQSFLILFNRSNKWMPTQSASRSLFR